MAVAAATRARLSAIAALAVVPVVFHVIIVETSRIHFASPLSLGALFRSGFVTVSAFTHWAIYGGLLLTFGLTLRPGRDPLITAMARKLHGPISGELVIYTRRVTMAWCCFFAAQLATSITLFVLAPLVVWSFFVNVLDIPMVVAMYTAEYFCRLHCLKDPPRHSLATILDMVADVRKPREERASSS
ncbi:MAG TPA: hypothetical protein VJS41_03840 [Stellaceae bacterium]|nr:hypothetical protein [Stellaceae bacterium]